MGISFTQAGLIKAATMLKTPGYRHPGAVPRAEQGTWTLLQPWTQSTVKSGLIVSVLFLECHLVQQSSSIICCQNIRFRPSVSANQVHRYAVRQSILTDARLMMHPPSSRRIGPKLSGFFMLLQPHTSSKVVWYTLPPLNFNFQSASITICAGSCSTC